MARLTVVARTVVPAPPEAVAAYLARPAAARRLLPPWEKPPGPAPSHTVTAEAGGTILEETAVADGSPERLVRLFTHRHRTLARDLARAASTRPLRVAITGASGLIGTALADALEGSGHTVLRLVRRPARDATEISWQPDARALDPSALEGVDAVVHLAGETIAQRWTAPHKHAIRASRVDSTALIAETLARMARPPRVLLSGSAIGIYGPRGPTPVDESATPGDDFLAEVVRAWEGAAAPAAERGVRVVHPRMGNVLSPRGGMLAALLPAFRAGVGGRIGGGDQGLSWITIEDAVGALVHALGDERLVGPVNVVAPAPVTNAEFARTLAGVLGRPSVLPLPRFAVSLAFGEMGRTLLLTGQRVVPRRLEETGYAFVHPRLDGALAAVLGRDPIPTPPVDGGVLRVVTG